MATANTLLTQPSSSVLDRLTLNPARRADPNTGRPRLAIAFACPALLTLSGDYNELTLMHEFTHALVGVGMSDPMFFPGQGETGLSATCKTPPPHPPYLLKGFVESL